MHRRDVQVCDMCGQVPTPVVTGKRIDVQVLVTRVSLNAASVCDIRRYHFPFEVRERSAINRTSAFVTPSTGCIFPNCQ